MSTLSQSVTQRIRLEHIQSLSQLATPPTLQAPIKTDLPWPVATILRNIILDWISSNPEAIKAAKDSQCMSPSPDVPNWGAVLFTLVESTAMYLRKDQDVFLAMKAARKGDTEAATRHLDNAQEDIDAIAQALDCKFVQLCDFAQQALDGLWFHSGAYAGVFISNDTQKPFAGIAFKGSSSIRDFFTDFNWQPIAPKKGLIWDAHTHRGFYQGMFGQFSGKDEKRIPFDIILEQLDSVYKHPTKLHVTGHSLGGAFATLAYGEFHQQSRGKHAKPCNARWRLPTISGQIDAICPCIRSPRPAMNCLPIA
ncbi:hypothetical protein BD413DRAFT_130897 [Trametes elegans]|nr:hypothetical protein BD413DRAFT_130897 [Trametes elegans]